jgi:hypothetical protein
LGVTARVPATEVYALDKLDVSTNAV